MHKYNISEDPCHGHSWMPLKNVDTCAKELREKQKARDNVNKAIDSFN